MFTNEEMMRIEEMTVAEVNDSHLFAISRATAILILVGFSQCIQMTW